MNTLQDIADYYDRKAKEHRLKANLWLCLGVVPSLLMIIFILFFI